MELPRRVMWKKGMQLTPQCFQHWDRYQDFIHHERFRTRNPFYWGVSEIRMIVKDGNFTIEQCRGLMPDGLIVGIPDSPDPLPSRSIEQLPKFVDYLDVFLAIPSVQEMAQNCVQQNTPLHQTARYLENSVQTLDLNTGKGTQNIPVVKNNFQIIFSGEQEPNYALVKLKIAELERNSGGEVVLRKSFIPPCLSLTASKDLMSTIDRILERLIGGTKSISDELRRIVDRNGADLSRFSIMSAAYAAIPLLAHLRRADPTHPEDFYLALTRLIGELAVFSKDFHPIEIPAYEHNNLSKTFRELEKRIGIFLDQIGPKQYTEILLERKNGYLVGVIHDGALLTEMQCYILAIGGISPQQICDDFKSRVKIGALGDMDDIKYRAVRGINTEHRENPPGSLPVSGEVQCFQLIKDSNNRYWKNLLESKELALLLPNEWQKMKIQFVAMVES